MLYADYCVDIQLYDCLKLNNLVDIVIDYTTELRQINPFIIQKIKKEHRLLFNVLLNWKDDYLSRLIVQNRLMKCKRYYWYVNRLYKKQEKYRNNISRLIKC